MGREYNVESRAEKRDSYGKATSEKSMSRSILFTPSDNNQASGAFRSMTALISILQKEYGHNILVVLPYDGSGKEMLDELGIPSVRIRSCGWTMKKGQRISWKQRCKYLVKNVITQVASFRIARLIRKGGFQLVHNNTSWGYVGALAAKRAQVPVVWHIREFLEEDQGRTIWNQKKGYELMKRSDRVIAISESISQKYTPIVGKERITTVLNGIDERVFYRPNHRIFESARTELVIVGAVCDYKGQNIAIRACALLRKRGYQDFRLRIVGSGATSYLQDLKKLVREFGLDDQVEFCGRTSEPEEYFASADIELMCSRSEAFGRVTVEAMLAGALVIGADTAATVEMIQDGRTGFLFRNGDAEDLADKILYAVKNKDEVRGIAACGQEYMLNNMTAGKNAYSINEIYQELLKG